MRIQHLVLAVVALIAIVGIATATADHTPTAKPEKAVREAVTQADESPLLSFRGAREDAWLRLSSGAR